MLRGLNSSRWPHRFTSLSSRRTADTPEYGVKRSVMVCAKSGYTRMLLMENFFSVRIALVGDPTIVPGSPAHRV